MDTNTRTDDRVTFVFYRLFCESQLSPPYSQFSCWFPTWKILNGRLLWVIRNRTSSIAYKPIKEVSLQCIFSHSKNISNIHVCVCVARISQCQRGILSFVRKFLINMNDIQVAQRYPAQYRFNDFIFCSLVVVAPLRTFSHFRYLFSTDISLWLLANIISAVSSKSDIFFRYIVYRNDERRKIIILCALRLRGRSRSVGGSTAWMSQYVCLLLMKV